MSSHSKQLIGATAGLVAAGSAALAWSLAEAHLFTLRAEQVSVLAPGSAPRRILHLSDLHMTPSQADKRRWVAALARLEPDLVVVTGDFLSHRLAVPAVMDALGPLLDFPGAFTLGSNDYLAPHAGNPLRYLRGPSTISRVREVLPWPDLVSGLTRWGWMDLDNQRHRLELEGWAVDARGVDDPHIRLDRYDRVAGPFEADSTLRLGVAHAPYLRVLDAMTADGADLILAGHTHGGQVRVPGYGALVSNCDLPPKRSRGLSTHRVRQSQSSLLHVSAGLGTSPFAPIRFACPPEATLLTLVARD